MAVEKICWLLQVFAPANVPRPKFWSWVRVHTVGVAPAPPPQIGWAAGRRALDARPVVEGNPRIPPEVPVEMRRAGWAEGVAVEPL